MKHSAIAALALALTTPAGAQQRPSVAPRAMQTIAPGLAGYTDDVLFGDIWLRPGLAPRDRSLVTLSVLIATGRTAQLPGHLGRGLDNGVRPAEIAGLVTHLAFYTGWPNAVSSLNEIEQAFAARRIDVALSRPAPGPAAALPAPDRARAATVRDPTAPVAAKFAALTDAVIFGDLWRRTDLTPRDRSLVTVAALAANGDGEQLDGYIGRALENGLSRDEIAEAFTHLAFYAGWPKASVAIAALGRIAGPPAMSAGPAPGVRVVSPGGSPASAPVANFTGRATVTSPFKGTGEARLGGATVAFAAGARTNWHMHPLGQALIVTAGRGWVQAAGEPVRAMAAGDVVWIAPGVKHWHGATRSGGMTHVAVAEARDGHTVTWLEPVTDDAYSAVDR